MTIDGQSYLREVQYRHPGRLKARALLHTKYGRGDWFDWLASNISLPPGGMVADMGCGAGAFWTSAPHSVPDDLKLRLFDISAGMVDAATQAAKGVGRWTDIAGAVADAAALPLEDGSADTVLAIHMLYHLADPAVGVGEMARVVRQHGAVAVVLNPGGTMAELSNLIDAALDRDAADRKEPLTSEQALPALSQAFGRIKRVRFETSWPLPTRLT